MYVIPEEAYGTIGFGCDVTGVICPAQVVANGDTCPLLLQAIGYSVNCCILFVSVSLKYEV